MAGSAKLLTAGGGGVLLTPASSISSDVTVNLPTNVDSLIGGIANGALSLCKQSILSSVSIPSGYSASSVGPITTATGVVVTIPAGSRWVIL